MRKILISEKELRDINFKRLKKAFIYIENNIIDSDMYLTVDSLIDIDNIITVLNNINVNVKPHGYDKMYIDTDLIEDKLYQLMDQFNERKINLRDFYPALLDNIQPFYDGNQKTWKILFVSNFS